MTYLLHDLLQASARRHPKHDAVVDEVGTLSYGELDRESNRLANLLLSTGVRRGDRVGLLLEKSRRALVAIYGVLKAGAGYVPLDPLSPAARSAAILSDCGVRVLVSEESRSDPWTGLEGAGLDTVVGLDAGDGMTGGPAGAAVIGTGALEACTDADPAVPAIDLDLAYVLYTSGSTGMPKGVMLSHRNAMTFVEWTAERFGVNAEDRLASHAPLHFDLSVFDLFAAAQAGATVVLIPHEVALFPAELGRYLEEHRVTVLYAVPSALTALTLRGGLEPGSLPDMRAVLFAGEPFPAKHLRSLMANLPHAAFFNLYGPTETNVCTYFHVEEPPDPSEEIPIGGPAPNTEVFALAEDGRICGPEEIGELHVRGANVTSGYWSDPERTAQVLIRDPRRGAAGDPVYRTGDLVRLDDAGRYWFLGRRDAQVKSRGYRIELGEIERVLLAHPGVAECAVVAFPDELITNRIAAILVAPGLALPELRRFGASRLPAYMLPQEFALVDDLPRTSTGKIDRRRLIDTLLTSDGRPAMWAAPDGQPPLRKTSGWISPGIPPSARSS